MSTRSALLLCLAHLLLSNAATASGGEAEPAAARGISSVVAWFMVSAVAAFMIWFIWRNARKEPE